MHSKANSLLSTLAELTIECSEPADVAGRAVALLDAMHAALAPIVSDRGVDALYRRSLYLVRSEHPWLTSVYESAPVPGEFASLHAALLCQTVPDGSRAVTALLQTFEALLTNLIGGSLTQRLLASVWDPHSSGDAVQDTSQ